MLSRHTNVVTWTVGTGLVGLLAFAGCSTPRAAGTDAAADTGFAFRCTASSECDDTAACTVDTCTASGMCNYMPVDALCPMGQHCQVGTGCTAAMTCTTMAMCDDTIACTIDSCDVGNVCGHVALDRLCTTPALPRCDAMRGCIAGSTTMCAAPADCNDSVACTLDSCGVDHMCRHVVMDSLCTGMDEHCDAALGCVVRHGCTTPADCVPFYNFCDGDPTCDPEFGCQSPATARVCNDGRACTIDSCDRASGTRGACAVACDRSMASCATTEPLCAVAAATCAGVFNVTGPNLTGTCLGGMLNWDFTQLTFENSGGVLLTVTPRELATMGVGPVVLNDAMAPVCPMFSATAIVDGGCREEYEVSGMFTDDNTVSGTVRIRFVSTDGLSCLLSGCTSVTSTFSGTRMP